MKIEELVILAKEAGIVLEEIRSSRTEGEILMEAVTGRVASAMGTHAIAIPYGPTDFVNSREKALAEALRDVREGTEPCTDSECEWCADAKAGAV